MKSANALGKVNHRLLPGSTFLTALLLAAGPLLMVPSQTLADAITDYAIFADGNVGLGNNNVINGGTVGANNSVTTGSGTTLQNVTGGGNFGAGNNSQIQGNVLFNGSVSTGSGASVLSGNNVVAGGNVGLGNNSQVTGNVTAGGSISLGSGASIGGTSNANQNPDPAPFTTVLIPDGTAFAAGGVNKTFSGAGNSLAPGTWGALTLQNNAVLNLTSGDYYFNSINSGSGVDLNIDAASGVRIFVVGNAILGNNLDIVLLNGTTADNIYLESKGSVATGSGVDWFGTIFADGNIGIGNTNIITGALYADGSITTGTGVQFTFDLASNLPGQFPVVSSVSAVPEPEIYAMLAAGLGLMGFFARRRRQAT
jgi:predicted acyltransferase (DUF342 family)